MRYFIHSFVLVLLLGGIISANGQNMVCGTDEFAILEAQQNPNYEQIQEHFLARYVRHMESRENAPSSIRSDCDFFLIPVVVHVVYQTGAQNISLAQIEDMIRVLNEDFRRIYGTGGFSDGADAKIQFALATKDPNGNPTNGVLRIQSNLTNHNQNNDANLKALSKWDTGKYLNMWVVQQIASATPQPGTILAYASLPDDGTDSNDGIVTRHDIVGTIGTGGTAFVHSLTHEVGHFLGLRHPFQGGCIGTGANDCLTAGDLICDTPQMEEAIQSCSGNPNTCSEDPCDFLDPLENYMGYAHACLNVFTPGQVERMHFFLTDAGSPRKTLVEQSNLVAAGVDSVIAVETKPQVNFDFERVWACANISTIQFFDQTDGCVSNYQWEFEGGTPAVSTDENPTVQYAAAGTYRVKLTALNSVDQDSIIREKLIQVTDGGAILPAQTVNWSESFESGIYPPVDWYIHDHDQNGSWEKRVNIGFDGDDCVMIPNFNGPSCESFEDLMTPVFDLTDNTSFQLSFHYAYQPAGVTADVEDRLLIQVTDDCGDNWTTVYENFGFLMATVSALNAMLLLLSLLLLQNGKTLTLNLDQFAGNPNVRVRFRMKVRNGQNFYMDNIRLAGVSLQALNRIFTFRILWKLYPIHLIRLSNST